MANELERIDREIEELREQFERAQKGEAFPLKNIQKHK